MLQQTQVKTVVPYFHKWIKVFPDVQTLAKADLETVLKVWEGLGYYSRCRNLHKSAKRVVEENHGVIPDSFEVLCSLPGIGEYTARAILSIGYGQPEAVIDGNVKRVMARYLGIRRLTNRNYSRVRNFLKDSILKEDPGAFNQALMDLGREVCLPKNPDCNHCPLEADCKAAQSATPESYPLSVKKQVPPQRKMVAVLIQYKDTFLVTRRPDNGLLGGLWGIPCLPRTGQEHDRAVIRSLFQEDTEERHPCRHLGAVTHAYSHFISVANLYHWEITRPKMISIPQPRRWITLPERETLPFSKFDHKLFSLFLNHKTSNV